MSFPDASQFYGPQFFEEFGGLSTRRLLEHAQSLGARGVKVGLGIRDEAGAREIRARPESASMYIEGIDALPRDETRISSFEHIT